ncbi:uncharacterized protein EKO05_0011399 [Ascochyta rabiei]|uniref:Uncharacterized protein n=1 Tax=Didymella rabiei TaxID=5454 RepID=A0A163KAX0_DIDRA|nr:uncharacterized protein EKO05_0011399 [Ascochyta rabiei]KZM26885.1 hypothetical protein ST47_g1977 [Ascochyta rabiei]UPX21205.1 hypothetical protein EKO05_0011399 [Ascochyta rabiei]
MLLDLPSALGFPKGMHPVLATNGLIAGDEDALGRLRLIGVVPAVVSTLVGGIPLRLGDFPPTNAAYQSNNNGLFSANAKCTIVPDVLSGPGLYPEAVDMTFVTAPTPRYSIKVLNSIID